MASGPNFPVFNFDPNWASVVTETLSWMTDVMTSVTGEEQRRSLLRAPRKKVEYMGLYAEADRAKLDNALTGYGAHDWLLPVWWDLHRLAQDVPAGSSFIPCDTTDTGLFFANRKALLRIDRAIFEVVDIAEVVADGLVLKSPVLNTYSASATHLMPLQQSRFDGQPQLMRVSDGVNTASFRFKVTEPDPLASIGFQLSTSTALISNGLVARRFSFEDDGAYDANAGVSIGQAAFARGALEAAAGLRLSKTATTVAEADRWQQIGQDLLDAVIDKGSRQGAILRRSAPVSPGEFVLPHWLYAARGPIGDIADAGEGYELIPNLKRLRDWYASSDGAALRDFHIALSYARSNDTRGGDARTTWRMLDDGMMTTQLLNRRLPDGRAIFDLWPGLPAVLPTGADPQGISCFSTHADSTPPNVLGVNDGNIGYNFLSRNSLGQVLFDVPDSHDYTQDTVPIPSSSGQSDGTQEQTGDAVVLRVMSYARLISDSWRDAQSWQSADQYMMIDYSMSRGLEADETIQVAVSHDGQMWSATLNGSETIVGNKHFVPRTMFVDPAGNTLNPGQKISGAFISITAKYAYRLTLSRMRLVPALDREEDNQPYFPGVDGFRTSGYNNLGLVVGYRGSPWIGGQTVDLWPMMAAEKPGYFAGMSADDMPIFDPGSRQIYFPLSDTNENGTSKSPEALLAEQATMFLLSAQSQYVSDSGGVLGPMAHTFPMNRPDSVEFGNVLPFSWLYQNIRSDRDVFWQFRAVEGLAGFARLVKTNRQGMTFNGTQMTFNGQKMTFNRYGQDAGVIPFDQFVNWADVYQKARDVVYSFLLWIDTNWRQTVDVVFGGTRVTFNGQQVRKDLDSNTDAYANIFAWVDDPRTTTNEFIDHNVYPIAMMLRTALYMRQADHEHDGFYDSLIRKCWRYLERCYQKTGEMKGTWSLSREDMDWRHGEIITALAEMLKMSSFVPTDIPIADVERRLIEAVDWVENDGSQSGVIVPGMDKFYLDKPVLTRAPDEKGNMSIDVERLTEDFDNDISIPLQSEYEPNPFNRPQYSWWMRGREQHDEFRRMLYAVRGRAVSFWKPTFSRDLLPVQDIEIGDLTMTVANVGYTSAGGPRRSREHVMFFLRDGTSFFRRIIDTVEIDTNFEQIRFSANFRQALRPDDILRISFLDLVRMDQDGFQLAHITDTDGVSTSTTVMRSVKVA